MDSIIIKMFPAQNGDCFLISLGTTNKYHVLIDCGYTDTYKKYLRDALVEISENKESINLFVISHIDQDHIQGAISFLQDNNENQLIEIDEIWHNSYRHLQFKKKKIRNISEYEKQVLIKEIRLGNSFLLRNKKKGISHEDISALQGSTLASLIYEGGYAWNSSFDGEAVNYDYKSLIKKAGFTIHLLSPDTNKLENLSQLWIKQLEKNKLNFALSDELIFDDAFEFFLLKQKEKRITSKDITRYSAEKNKLSHSIEDIAKNPCDETDNSITNGSSISFVLEYENRRILFLADSHPEIIINNLLKLDFNFYDAVKVAHHGSKKNTNSKLVKLINSNIFLISTNGDDRYSHPDIQSLSKLIYYQKDHQKKFIFNYVTKISELMKNKDWKEKYNYEILVPSDDVPMIIKL